MSRTRVADDFDAIRLRLEELQRQRTDPPSGAPADKSSRRQPDAAAHVPTRTTIPVPSTARRPGSV
jgi:hypothetical protein